LDAGNASMMITASSPSTVVKISSIVTGVYHPGSVSATIASNCRSLGPPSLDELATAPGTDSNSDSVLQHSPIPANTQVTIRDGFLPRPLKIDKTTRPTAMSRKIIAKTIKVTAITVPNSSSYPVLPYAIRAASLVGPIMAKSTIAMRACAAATPYNTIDAAVTVIGRGAGAGFGAEYIGTVTLASS
jgi:hypothetical protein